MTEKLTRVGLPNGTTIETVSLARITFATALRFNNETEAEEAEGRVSSSSWLRAVSALCP
jgi:hypothetical protein